MLIKHRKQKFLSSSFHLCILLDLDLDFCQDDSIFIRDQIDQLFAMCVIKWCLLLTREFILNLTDTVSSCVISGHLPRNCTGRLPSRFWECHFRPHPLWMLSLPHATAHTNHDMHIYIYPMDKWNTNKRIWDLREEDHIKNLRRSPIEVSPSLQARSTLDMTRMKEI